MSTIRTGFPKALAALAVAIGIAGGSYGFSQDLRPSRRRRDD